MKACPVCAVSLSATYDTDVDELTLRPENLPPLVKDKLAVVAAYKRIKDLDGTWQRQHGARALIYADMLLLACGFTGGQLDRAVGLMEWLQASGRDWSLDSAATHYNAYEKHVQSIQRLSHKLCGVCGEQFAGDGNLCERHSWVKETAR